KTINSGDSVTLNGTGADTDGSITAYEWSTGGSVVGSAQGLTVSPTTTTTYKFRVKDDKGLWSEYDEVSVTVGSANTAPTVSNPTSSGDLEFGNVLSNIGLDISDDDLSKVTWTLSGTQGGGDGGTFSQSSGTGNTLHGITFNATIGSKTGRTIKATITDSGSGNSETVTIYSN
ncbi:hypothetical protein EOM39_04375, partial [Candidatus Gracilibacteria bacterium]|nr:hypothetical protein [Candidatus Gracilibacteria bacterium]